MRRIIINGLAALVIGLGGGWLAVNPTAAQEKVDDQVHCCSSSSCSCCGASAAACGTTCSCG